MIESSSPFSVVTEIIVPVPSLVAWDAFVAADQVQWNHAMRSFQASLGFHTGSKLEVEYQTLKGPRKIKAEVLDATPQEHIVFQHPFRYFLFQHTETWAFSFVSISDNSTLIKVSYGLEGTFASKIWSTEKKVMVTNVLELWLESLKAHLEKM